MSYNSPTLTEIYLKLTFDEGTLSEENFFEIVPIIKRAGLEKVEMGQVLEQAAGTTARPLTRIRCWDREQYRLVQLSPDTVVINQTKEYLGWSKFRELISMTLKALNESGVQSSFKSIELNTIDQFDIPSNDFRFGKWLNCESRFIPSWYEDATEPCDIDLGKGIININGRNRQFHVRVEMHQKTQMMHVRMQGVFHELVNAETFDEKLDALHNEANEQFESVITDNLRNEVMQGRKQ